MARNESDVQAAPRLADGRIDFATMGLRLADTDSDGKPLEVNRGGKTYTGALIIEPVDLDKMRTYLHDEAILAALNGTSWRVAQQDVCRNYLEDCSKRKAKPMAAALENKLWDRIRGERMKPTGGPRKIVRVITLPGGDIYQGEPSVEALRSAVMADLMEAFDLDPQMALARVNKMEKEGKLHDMLGLEKPAAE